ncbi:MAG: N-acyl-D-amino-acid deacylase family protein [Microthrixaceae bacterium]
MAHDLIIRNGTVIDGSGGPPVPADVAVDGPLITEVGDLSDAVAREELDAGGLVVSPGFIDLHTHLDAQVAWDPFMTSSSWQGVTTALIGNCGLSFAPVADGGAPVLAEMMESVEDIPRDAILGSLPWDWSSYPEYLDSVDAMRPALNVVGLVGHAALRYLAMGDRAHDRGEEPTPAELSLLRDLVGESVDGGAVGFSTSRILLHVVPDGRKLPGTWAANDELLAMADGMRDAGGGIFQVVPDYETRAANEFELFTAMAAAGTDVLFTMGPGNDPGADPMGVVDLWSGFLASAEQLPGRLTGYMMTRPSGSLMGLWQVPPVRGSAWRRMMQLPTLDERLAALVDPAVRAELVAEGVERGLLYDAAHVYPLGTGELPEYHEEGGRSVAQLAEEAGVHPVEFVIDRLVASEGRELFNMWFFNRNLEAIGPLLELEGVYPGAGDTGAHAGQICDADAPTHFLSHWCRDRGVLSLAEGVRRLTSRPAEVLGLTDRGIVRAGLHADLNVFDPERLEVGYPTYVHDFPGGSGRLRVGATGYAATLVNGEVVTSGGTNTGARPGRVLRGSAR